MVKTLKRFFKKPYDALIQVKYIVSRSGVQCNVCGSRTGQFWSDDWHKYIICPVCKSNVRERLLWAALCYVKEVGLEKTIKQKSVLHFAPEKSLRGLLKKNCFKYDTADFFAPGYSYSDINYNLDISNMPQIKNNTYDCVIACDVLEHVPNHLKGINEVYRILSKGGYCIFTVPQKDHLNKTDEDLTIIDPEKRKERFGQWDHFRIYGSDFGQMMRGSGFEVTEIDEHYFSKEQVRKFVLSPPVLSDNPMATNYRKVFFGKKV